MITEMEKCDVCGKPADSPSADYQEVKPIIGDDGKEYHDWKLKCVNARCSEHHIPGRRYHSADCPNTSGDERDIFVKREV